MIVCSLPLPALGQSPYNWTDAQFQNANQNQLWSVAGNWDPGTNPPGVPGVTCTSCSAVIGIINHPGFTTFPIQDTNVTLQNLTVNSGTKNQMKDVSLTIMGSLSGDIEMNNSGGAVSTQLFIDTALTYTNGLNGIDMQNNSEILGKGTLTNQGTIQYGESIAGSPAGAIGDGGLTLKNSGTVVSGGTGSLLDLCTNTGWTNTGTLQALSGGKLAINCGGKIMQTGSGNVSADAGTVTFGTSSSSSPTIIGGTLASPSGGTLQTGGTSASPTLQDLTITGSYNVLQDSSTILDGTITNNGSITLNNGPNPAQLLITNDVTLTGTGSVFLGGANTSISGSTLTNQQTIKGAGTIDVTVLDNQGPNGTISAAANNGDTTLTIEPGAGEVTNTGTITAASGTVEISGGTVTNTGGTISAGTGLGVLAGGVTIVGGTIVGQTGNSVEGKLATLDGTSSPVTITGPFEVLGGDKTILKGTINGTGPINVSACPNSLVLQASGTTVVNTPVVLGNDCPQDLFEGDGKNDVTINDSISGNGKITLMILIIGPKGEIIAGPFAATPLIIDSTAKIKVEGILIVDVNVILEIDGVFLNLNLTTDDLVGGIYIINGTMDLPAGNMIKTNGGKLTLNFPGKIQAGGVNALGQLSKNTGTITLTGGEVLDVVSPFTNTGKIIIGVGNTFSAGGAGTSYNQSAGATTVDGTLAAGNVNITGGTLQGKGAIQGSVVVGNPSGGAVATFIIGDDTKHAGAQSISQNYTQLATGAMDVQIGGTTPGSQYSELTVTGPVSLSGTLNLKRINSFNPTVGQQFTIINAPSGITGTFSTVNGTAISSTKHFAVSHTSTTVVVTVVAGP